MRSTSASQTFGLNAISASMELACKLLPPIAQGFLAYLKKGGLFPSPAMLCRGRFLLDVAFMALMSDVFEALCLNGAVLYGLLDSSPQGGRNYLMTEVFYIAECYILICFEAALALTEFAKGNVHKEFDEQAAVEYKEQSDWRVNHFVN